MNGPINVPDQLEQVFKQSSSSGCSHCEIMRPRRHLTMDLQAIAIAMLQSGRSQAEVAPELEASQCHQQVATEILRDWKSHRKA